jgi:hypothetical protein
MTKAIGLLLVFYYTICSVGLVKADVEFAIFLKANGNRRAWCPENFDPLYVDNMNKRSGVLNNRKKYKNTFFRSKSI